MSYYESAEGKQLSREQAWSFFVNQCGGYRNDPDFEEFLGERETVDAQEMLLELGW